MVKRDLGIEFGREQLTSYGGLELVRRYFRSIGLNRRIRQGFREHNLGGDYGCVHLVVLVVGLLVVGARRLKHLRYVAHDPAAPAAARTSVVAPAQRSPNAQRKANTKLAADDTAVHSFHTLLTDLATLAKNRIVPSTNDSVPFDLITTPTAIQQRAFDLLRVNYRM